MRRSNPEWRGSQRASADRKPAKTPAQIVDMLGQLPQPSFTCSFFVESLYVSFLLLKVVLGLILDALTCNRVIAWEKVDAEWVSSQLGKKCVAVTLNESMMNRNLENVGAGGTGTSRGWLTCTFEDGTEQMIFAKKPTSLFGERLFLSAFRVYYNEFNFYKIVSIHERFREDPEVAALFPKPMVVWWKGQNFLLLMEDLAQKEAEFVPIINEYPLVKVNSALRSFARLHAHFWARPPQGVWTDEWSCKLTVPPTPGRTRPRFLRLIAGATLRRFLSKYGAVLSPELLAGYEYFVKNFSIVREFWSRPPLTLAHGDAHIGNLWFTENSTQCGFFDMQCNAAENCMRDITYNLISGCDSIQLQNEETRYLQMYLGHLNGFLEKRGIEPLGFKEAWFQYRMQAWWVLAAFLISAGANNLMEQRVGRITMIRISKALTRLNSLEALHQVLAEHYQGQQ